MGLLSQKQRSALQIRKGRTTREIISDEVKVAVYPPMPRFAVSGSVGKSFAKLIKIVASFVRLCLETAMKSAIFFSLD